MATGPNPFDEYESLDAATPGEDTLRPGPTSSLMESLTTNFMQPFQTGLLGSLRARADKTTIDKADRGEIAGPGSTPFDGKVSQAGADAARQRLAQLKRDKEAYDAFESDTALGKATGLLGGLAGMVVQPENALSAGGVVAGGFATAFGKTAAARIGGAAAEAGLVNAAIDVPTQALQVGAGLEDKYSPAQTAAAFGVGAVLGGGMAALSEVVTRRIAARDAAATPPAAESAPALAQSPEDATAALQAAHAAKSVDDETLAKVAEGAALAGRSDDGSVQVPLSLDEGSRLAQAGAPVSEAGVMPGDAADAVVREASVRAEAAAVEEARAAPAGEAAAAAAEPEPVTVGAPRLAASGLDAADAVKKQWRAEATYDDPQAMLKAAPANQQALGDVGREIAEELGVKFKDPGVKALDADALAALDEAGRAKKQKGVDRFLDKVGTKKPGTVTDLVRAGFDLTSPDQGEAILAKLAEKFEVIDEGWVQTPVGYFDRKVYVRFADGMIGELQMWEPSLLSRKEGGGHALYEEARKLKPGDPRLAELNEKMVALYQDAFDGLSPDWRSAIDGTGGASGNFAANASADSTRALTPTSAELAGSQAAAPSGRTNASAGDQSAASPSRDANTNSAITGTSGGTVADGSVRDKVSPIGVEVPGLPAHRVTTAAGRVLDVQPTVVEASELKTSSDEGYDKTLQPRQRDRAASQAQIREIATGLDPERLGYSAEADRGAPIIGDDGMVESGNGRVLAIRSVYAKGGEKADAYRAFIEAQGVDTTGMAEPVLVRQRITPLTPEERAAFGTEANQAATLAMSAAERGMSDARLVSPEMLDLIRNADDLGAAANLDFRKAFVKALPASERGALTTTDGGLSSEGLTRVRNAVLARAYGDSGILARIAEATNDDVKSISNAVTAAAPEWAKLRSDIESGTVRADVDMTPSLLEAVNRTAELRGRGEKLDTFLSQQDAFDKLDQSVEDWMRMFYDPKGRRAAGSPVIAERLKAYAIEARKVSADGGLDLGLPAVTARDLQTQAAKRGAKNGTETQGGLALTAGDGSGASGVQPGVGARDVAGNAGERGQGTGDAGERTGNAVGAIEGTTDGRVLKEVSALQGDGFTVKIWDLREKLGLEETEFRDTVQSLLEQKLVNLSQYSSPKSYKGKTGLDIGGDTKHIIRMTPEGRAALVDAEKPAAATAQPLKRNATSDTRDNPDTRFDRRQLAGEDGKPRTLPADATAAEVAAFRVSDAMRSIAERMGLKLELDGRFTARGALGEYKPGEGVLRIRAEGDVEVFAHELGHALDRELSALPSWQTFTKTFERELRDLDANDPVNPTTAEGIAEFLRGYITNPAYARRQNPAMTDVFEKLIARDRADLAAIVNDASRLSQIDSGMEPADVLRTMITTAIEPTGLAKFNDERKRLGLLPTLSMWFDRAYAGMFGKDHWVRRYTEELRGAHFQRTGTPMPEFTESAGYGFRDPYQSYRMLVGAKQAAVDGLYEGPKAYGDALGNRVAPGVYQALDKAFNGKVTLIDNPNDPLVRSFSAYLIARRAKALYSRWENGELRNPPIRASKNEVEAGLITLEAENPQFKSAADDIVAFSNAMWQKKFDAGIISREINDIVSNRNDDYVPFYRDFRDEKAGGGGRGGGGLQQNGVKTMKGSSRDILDPVHSIIFDAMQTERIIALNDTMKFMHRLAQTGGEFSGRFLERVPNSEMKAQSFDLAEGMRNAARSAGLDKADAEVMIRHLEEMVGDDMSATVFKATETTPRGERIMFYWEGGERVALKVGDNEVSRQFFDLVSGQTAAERDVMLAIIGKANALFSQLITNAPQFALKNIIMDNVSRIFISRNTGALGRIPGAAIASGIYTQIFDKEFARAYAAVGGIRGGVVSAATRELDEIRGVGGIALRPKDLRAMAQEAMALMGNPKDLAIAVVKSPLHALEAVIRGIEATETVGRLGQAKIVNNYLLRQGLTREEAFHAAAFEARDVLDYDRKGWAVSSATRILPFLNAGFQGIDRSQRNLFGAPVKAAIESYRRGGYANLDGEAKSALKDAVMNWGLIAGGIVTTMSYYAMNADDPVYQRMSDYMKRRYYVFPGGQREDGTQMVVTVPKPFDHAGGIFAAVEAAMDGIRRQDPETWHKVTKNLQEGFIPRQLGGIAEFMSSLPPTLKVPFEVLTGTKLGFDGGPSFPIVPANLKALPPEMQYTGTTGYVSKKLGEWFGLSPLVAEHVMTGLGGTTARDASTLATAIFDDQPNTTMSDAMTRTFFGALYRGQTGGGSFKSYLMQVMARDNGQYAVLAKGYLTAVEAGDSEDAASIYGRGNDIAKTIMTVRAGPFKPEERQIHPLERTASLGDILSKVTRDLSSSQVERVDRSRKRGTERDYIELQPTTARALTGTLGYLMAEEIRNGLSIVGQGGYEGYKTIDTRARYDAIRALSPEVADEIQRRMKKAHILPAETVERAWPELKRRLLQDREQAKLRDLKRPQ